MLWMSADHGRTVFLGSSAAAERLRLQVQRFAPHFRTMLLVGEPGTGKQSVGRELHRLGPAGDAAFCVVEMEHFLAGADVGNVIYLKGLSGAPAELQQSLVRRLAALGRETRLIVPCEGEPRALLAAGKLRAGVLERVGMLEIRVPALRERMDDLDTLTMAMLAQFPAAGRLSDAQRGVMHSHSWPRNLAELREACERFAASGEISFGALVDGGGTNTLKHQDVRLEQVIERHVLDVLERCAGNKLKASELLGISRSTLYRMLEASRPGADCNVCSYD